MKQKKITFDENNFKTEYSKGINKSLIDILNDNIDLNEYIKKIKNLGLTTKTAHGIVSGIFEFSLVTVTNRDLMPDLVIQIFNDQFLSIYDNINPESRLENKSLIEKIKSGIYEPEIVAFLSPDQLFPENWAEIHDKNQKREDAEKNLATTDLYECKYCHNRKCRVTQFQIRSSDEPMTTFITCMCCYRVMRK